MTTWKIDRMGPVLVSLASFLACGGTVIDDESPRERLTHDGDDACLAACKVITSCPAKSCDCACDASVTPEDCAASCSCLPKKLDDCASSCKGQVAKVLASNDGCEGEMLAILTCAPKSTCNESSPCKAESDAFERCQIAARASNPNRPGPTAPTCSHSTGSAISDPADPAVPGSVACEAGLSGCSDGSEYRVTCTAQTDGTVSCECSDKTGPTFTAASCAEAMPVAGVNCHWPG